MKLSLSFYLAILSLIWQGSFWSLFLVDLFIIFSFFLLLTFSYIYLLNPVLVSTVKPL